MSLSNMFRFPSPGDTHPANRPPPGRRLRRRGSSPATPVGEIVSVNRLMYFLGQNRRRGGRAPGPDGVRYEDLGRQELARLFERLRAAVLARTYAPTLPRLVRVPKPAGGHRTLALADLTHRALEASVKAYLDPVYAPFMSDNAHSVPGRGVWTLLTRLAAAFAAGTHPVLVTLDVRDAFGSLDPDVALGVVRRVVADDHLVWLVGTLLRADRNVQVARTMTNTPDLTNAQDLTMTPASMAGSGMTTSLEVETNTGIPREVACGPASGGIPQGSATSPAHLDLVLSAELDRHWPASPDLPLLARYVDDLAVLTRSVDEGREAVSKCRTLLAPLGMTLKDQAQGEAVTDLSAGGTTELLGFRVSAVGGAMKFGITATALDSLRSHLTDAHDTDNPSVTARSVVQGWLGVMGPAFDHLREGDVPRSVLTVARRAGFKEFRLEDLMSAWRRAGARWGELQRQPRPTITQRSSTGG